MKEEEEEEEDGKSEDERGTLNHEAGDNSVERRSLEVKRLSRFTNSSLTYCYNFEKILGFRLWKV